MRTLRSRTRRGRAVLSLSALAASTLSLILLGAALPQPAAADTDLDIGGTGVIAYANGDNVRLRTAPGYENDVIAMIPEGTAVDVLDGTFTASDGTQWYKVAVGGETGFIVSEFLADGTALLRATSGTATTTNYLNLRAGPSLGDAIVAIMAPGAAVTLTGENRQGWLSVDFDGMGGYAYSAFLTQGGDVSEPDESDSSGDGGRPAFGQGTRWMLDVVNLRAGAGPNESVIGQLAVGAAVELTGSVTNGYAEVVTSDGGSGWVAAEYLGEREPDTPAPAEPAAPAEPEEPEAPAGPSGTRYTSDAVNLRGGAGLDESVLRVLGRGTTVELTGEVTNGFAGVWVDDDRGWVAAEYLAESPPAAPAPASSAIIWPVRGGEWEISQGYNGTSHQNRDQYWQYQYSFDIVRSDGDTAGQPVYSPVDGTVRWYDPSTGGVSIDMGDGRAFAMFHAEFDGGVAEGERVSQGQYLGYVSYPGDGANGGFPHLHITIWETNDGGNWSRVAVPFSGENAIAGESFPNSGAYREHDGYTFTP